MREDKLDDMNDVPVFKAWPKIGRLSNGMSITEKLDGTNACIGITKTGVVFAQSRNRLITPENDNFGFATWVKQNEEELSKLGPGYHYGEWWGSGIQREYGLNEKRFSLFNVQRWKDNPNRPECCHVVPIIEQGAPFTKEKIEEIMEILKAQGSYAVPGWMKPEGIVIYHHGTKTMFKDTFEYREGKWKGE